MNNTRVAQPQPNGGTRNLGQQLGEEYETDDPDGTIEQ